MSSNEAILPPSKDNESYEQEENVDENHKNGEVSRLSYLSDTFEDEKSNKSCCERYFSPIKGGSLRGAVISLASIVFGISGLAFPLGFDNMGLVPALILLTFLCSVTYWSLAALLQAGRKKKIMHYGLLIKECLGNKMALMSDINNIIFCFGVLMSFEFTISSFFFDIFGKFYTINSDNEKTIKLIQMGTCMILLQLPLSLLKDISKLQYASMVGCFTLIYTSILIVVECPFFYQEGRQAMRPIPWFKSPSMKIFDSFSIFLYAFASHNGIFPIFDELHKPSKRRSFSVLNRAYLLEIVLFLFIGFGGFFSLLPKTPSIFISRKDLSFSWMKFDYFMLISKCLFFITLHCITAINNNIIRNSFKSLIFKGKDIPFKIDFIGIVVLLLVTNTITFFVQDVLSIISVIGGICAVIVSFLSPILCWIKANELPLSHIKNILALILLVIIIITGCISAGYSIYKDITGNE